MLDRRTRPLFVLAAVLAIAGCGGDGGEAEPSRPSGDERPFAMGFSSLPPDLNEESYPQAFELAGQAGELILIQRVPPWEELLNDDISGATAQATTREKGLAGKNGLDLFIAVDPTDVASGRRQLAGLPEDLQGAGFEDSRIREAFLDYARHIAVNYQPKYLALGVEMNSYYDYQPDDFEQFVTLYHEAYDAVKEVAPETLVFTTFQFERLVGRAPDGQRQPAQWSLLEHLEPKLDIVAISSYPGLVFDDPDDIPGSYYRALSRRTERPIAIAQTGYPSASATRSGSSEASEADQANYLRRILDDAEELEMPFVVWFTAWDLPSEAGQPLELLQHLGLLREDGSRKASWSVWESASRRPVPEQTSAREQ